MGEGMVANEVSGGVNAAGEVAAVADEASDEKEGCADVVPGKDFKQLRGAGIVGTVVVGEGVFVGVAPGEDSPAEDLRRGPHGSVEVSADGKPGRCGSGAEGGEHWD